DVRVPLDELLEPAGVRRVEAQVEDLDVDRQQVTLRSGNGEPVRQTVGYDRLVFALGSQLVRPPVPGLAEYAFDVDTFYGAQRLALHLVAERKRAALDGSMTVV